MRPAGTVTLDGAAAEDRIAFLLALRGKGLHDTAVLRAFETVPRSRYVPRRFVDLAYTDVALPIACGQSTLAPSVMAEMITALDVRPEHRVLEVGAGSGYGTAILARLAAEVASVERFRSLAIEARGRLEAHGVANASVHLGDGRQGLPARAPFDRILVEASFTHFPQALGAQLAPTGRLVGVERGPDGSHLVRYSRASMREWQCERLMPLGLAPLMAGIAAAL